jgi:hypothetical protein
MRFLCTLSLRFGDLLKSAVSPANLFDLRQTTVDLRPNVSECGPLSALQFSCWPSSFLRATALDGDEIVYVPYGQLVVN